MNKISFSIICLCCLLFNSCVNQEDRISYSENNFINEKIKIYKSANVKQIYLDSTQFIQERFLIDDSTVSLGDYNISKYKNGKLFIVSQRNCSVGIIDTNLSLINSFAIKGKGLGYLSFINSFAIIDTVLIFYDSSLRKFVEYNFSGHFLYQKMNKNIKMPYHISDMIFDENKYYFTGIDNMSYQKYNNQKEYENLFVVSDSIDSLFNKFVLHPEIMKKFLINNDISASPVSNPFFLRKYENNLFVFDQHSGEFISCTITNDSIQIANLYYIDDRLFARHTPLTKNNFDPESNREWFESGSFLIDLFYTEFHLIIYITKYNKGNKKINHYLLFVNKRNMEVGYILYWKNNYLKLVNNNSLVFIGYESEKNIENGVLTLFRIHYNKLF